MDMRSYTKSASAALISLFLPTSVSKPHADYYLQLGQQINKKNRICGYALNAAERLILLARTDCACMVPAGGGDGLGDGSPPGVVCRVCRIPRVYLSDTVLADTPFSARSLASLQASGTSLARVSSTRTSSIDDFSSESVSASRPSPVACGFCIIRNVWLITPRVSCSIA